MEQKQRRKAIDLSCHDKLEQIVVKASCKAVEASNSGRFSQNPPRDQGEVRTSIEVPGACHSAFRTAEKLFLIEHSRATRHKGFGWRSRGAMPFTTFHNVCFG